MYMCIYNMYSEQNCISYVQGICHVYFTVCQIWSTSLSARSGLFHCLPDLVYFTVRQIWSTSMFTRLSGVHISLSEALHDASIPFQEVLSLDPDAEFREAEHARLPTSLSAECHDGPQKVLQPSLPLSHCPAGHMTVT